MTLFSKLKSFYANTLTKKTRVGILLTFFLIVFIVFIHFIKSDSLLSLTFVLGVTCIGFYELLNAFKFNNLSIFILLTTLIFTVIDPFSYVKDTITQNVNGDISTLLVNSFNWGTLIVSIVAVSLTFFDKAYRTTVSKGAKLVFIILFTFPLLTMFSKSLFIILSLSWKATIYFAGVGIFTDTMSSVFGALIGKKFGGYKLAPKISPNKTWNGAIMGYLWGVGWAFGMYFVLLTDQTFYNGTNFMWWILLMILLLPIISILGDLFFSYIKRSTLKKDFSTLIPGHGGIFDRVDSHIFIFAFVGIFYLI